MNMLVSPLYPAQPHPSILLWQPQFLWSTNTNTNTKGEKTVGKGWAKGSMKGVWWTQVDRSSSWEWWIMDWTYGNASSWPNAAVLLEEQYGNNTGIVAIQAWCLVGRSEYSGLAIIFNWTLGMNTHSAMCTHTTKGVNSKDNDFVKWLNTLYHFHTVANLLKLT